MTGTGSATTAALAAGQEAGRTETAVRTRRRGPADPVRLLIHRHQAMCAAAVHPWEIAAGLQAHGITDRAAAAEFRHRDVVSLAEELYARVTRVYEPEPVPHSPPRKPGARHRTLVPAAAHLLPGLFCLGGTAALYTTSWSGRAVAAVTGAGALAALWVCLRLGPLRGTGGRWPALGQALCTGWLLAFWVFGGWVLQALPAVVGGAPDGRDPVPPAGMPTAAALTALALAVAPAAWCASWYTRCCRERLADSAGLHDFTAAARRAARRTAGIFLAVLLALLAAADLADGRLDPGSTAAAASLGLLLFVSRLLAAHGRTAYALAGLVAACGMQAAALGAAALGGLLSSAWPPVAWAAPLTAHPAAVPALTCTAVLPALVFCAHTALGRVGAHRPRL